MRTPLANAIFYGVMVLLLTGNPLKLKAQNSLPPDYLEAWDEDSNEKITHAEFYKGMSSASFFEAWDLKKDAKIDRQEFYAGMERLRSLASGSASIKEDQQMGFYDGGTAAPAQKDLARIFEEADLNRNQSLNKGEFCTFIFRQLDEDQNGMLSYLEADSTRLAIFSAKSW